MGILAVNFFVYAAVLDYKILFVENGLCNCYSRRTCLLVVLNIFDFNFFVYFLVSI